MPQIDVSAVPSGDGCADCEAVGRWWLHLRRCAACGHVGCCDSSPHRHASAHAADSGHRYVQSYEPGESWWWDYRAQTAVIGPSLAPPTSHPLDQPVPGPADRLPADWELQLMRTRDGD